MANINYVTAATALDSAVSFDVFPVDQHTYETLDWHGTSIAKVTLEEKYLSMMKDKQIADISAIMGAEVVAGFLSDALLTDTFRRYNSDLQGQIAVVGALVYLTPHDGITVPEDYTLSSVDLTTGVRGYHAHTYPQLYKLFSDLGVFSSAEVNKLTIKITAIYSIDTGVIANDLDSVYAITWTSTE